MLCFMKRFLLAHWAQIMKRVFIIGFACQAIHGSEPFRLGDATHMVENLNAPGDVFIQDDGSWLVTDARQGLIRVFDKNGSPIRVFGLGHLKAPHSIALFNNRYYVSDPGQHLVVVFDQQGAFYKNWHGSKPGQFNRPMGMAAGKHRLYIADQNRVLAFDQNESLLFEMKVHQPIDVAIDDLGFVYVADGEKNKIHKFNARGESIKQWGDWGPYPGLFDEPHGLFWHDGQLLVADTRNHRIQAFNREGEFLYVWGSHEAILHEGNGKLHYPSSIAVSPDGSFAVVGETLEERCQMISTGPKQKEAFVIPGLDKNRTHFGEYLSTDDNLLAIAEPESHYVYLFDIREEIPIIVSRFGERGEGFGLMMRTTGLDLEGTRILTTDPVLGRIQEFRTTYRKDAPLSYTPELAKFISAIHFTKLEEKDSSRSPGKMSLTCLKGDGKGLYYAIDDQNAKVLVFDKDWRVIRSWDGAKKERFQRPTDLAIDASGKKIYVVDSLNNLVSVFNRKGKYQFSFGANKGPGGLLRPFGVTTDRKGFVYVSDRGNHRIVKYDETGQFVAAWGKRGSGMGEFWSPAGLVMSKSNRLFVIDYGNHRAQIFRPDGTWLVTFGAGRAYTPDSLPLKP